MCSTKECRWSLATQKHGIVLCLLPKEIFNNHVGSDDFMGEFKNMSYIHNKKEDRGNRIPVCSGTPDAICEAAVPKK